MEFLYAIINFLILFAILFVFGRKMAGKIFSDRLERVERGLDEAERAEELLKNAPELPAVPTSFSDAMPDSVLAETEAVRRRAEE